MATRPRWCMSQGHRAPFGAIWGRFGAKSHRLPSKTGKARVKGTPHVARVDSVPKHSDWTPPVPIPEPSGPVWGHLGLFWGQIGQRTHPAGGKRAQRGTTGPLRWLLGVPGPIQGAEEPQRGVSIFGPVLGRVACCLLLAARRAGSSHWPKPASAAPLQLGDPNPSQDLVPGPSCRR